jgi:hypothetical protein
MKCFVQLFIPLEKDCGWYNMSLNDGTQYSNIVKAIHPLAYCKRAWIEEGTTMYYVLVPAMRGFNDIIGRGLSGWLAWKNTSWYIEQAMLRKLES